MLAGDAGADQAPAGGSIADRPHGDPPALPWLPSDDFAVQVPSVGRPWVPEAPEAPEAPAAPVARAVGAAHNASGLIQRLLTRLPVRVDPGRRGAIAVGIAVLVAAVVTGGWVLSSRPRALAVTGTGAGPAAVASARSAASSAASLTSDAAPGPSSAVPTSPGATLVVDVAGKVRHPGLYRLASGSRIDDAVQAAGGALPGVDLTTLNLAAKVADGQQIAVGMPGAAPAGGSGGGTGATRSAAAAGPVDLNSATLEQLETLPGVGPVLGQHIIDWRVAHGQFATIDQLRDVSGIGEVKFAALRSQVTV